MSGAAAGVRYSVMSNGNFLVNKFLVKNKAFTHCNFTSCHKAPRWAGGSWINTWKKLCHHSDPLPSISCSFENCTSDATLGAHVMYSGSLSKFASWYIIPACAKCNRQHGKSAPIKPDTLLLKVMKGKILKKNKIILGYIDVEEYQKIKDRLNFSLEFNNSRLKEQKTEYFKQKSKHVRRWHGGGQWGW
jgi:hypothetical protein